MLLSVSTKVISEFHHLERMILPNSIIMPIPLPFRQRSWLTRFFRHVNFAELGDDLGTIFLL